jgi:hypothetical protein
VDEQRLFYMGKILEGNQSLFNIFQGIYFSPLDIFSIPFFYIEDDYNIATYDIQKQSTIIFIRLSKKSQKTDAIPKS